MITVEDPPEYPIPGARQMPVTNANTEEEKDEQFTKALSAALRSDPDVMMVGEIRTLSAAQLTFKGALSGHGMWTTLHANSAPAILTRFRDMGVETFKLLDRGTDKRPYITTSVPKTLPALPQIGKKRCWMSRR